jgi:hypothetical protein
MMLSANDDWIDCQRVIFTSFKKVAQKTSRTHWSISTKNLNYSKANHFIHH